MGWDLAMEPIETSKNKVLVGTSSTLTSGFYNGMSKQ